MGRGTTIFPEIEFFVPPSTAGGELSFSNFWKIPKKTPMGKDGKKTHSKF